MIDRCRRKSSSCITDTSDCKSESHSDSYSEERKCHTKYRKKWDVAYLANYLDRCDLLKRVKKCEKGLIQWLRTFSPNGTQALLWSPRGRDIVLGRKKMRDGAYFNFSPLSAQLNFNIENKNLIALTTNPNFFFFDIAFAQVADDLLKLCECTQPIEEVKPVTLVSLVIFVIFVVFLIALAWLTYTMWGKYH